MDNKEVHSHDEDAIIEKVLAGSTEDLDRHLFGCPECADFIKDIQTLKTGLASIEDEEPPPFHPDQIRKNEPRKPGMPWIQDIPLELFSNPFVLTFGFFLFALVMYILFAFVFK
jgi:hypothetical protein